MPPGNRKHRKERPMTPKDFVSGKGLREYPREEGYMPLAGVR
jgi:hypothetical protein